MKSFLSAVSQIGLVVLLFMAAGLNGDLAYAQVPKEGQTKENKEQKKPSSGFQDDQSAMCLSATRQAKLFASVLETYSRRLGSCVISNPNFRDDCSVEFARVAKGYNEYQFAISSVRNYCN